MEDLLLVSLFCYDEGMKQLAKKQRKINKLIALNFILVAFNLYLFENRITKLESQMKKLNSPIERRESEDKVQKGE